MSSTSGLSLGGFFHRLGAVRGLADDGVAADIREQFAQPFTRQFRRPRSVFSCVTSRIGSTTVTV